MAATIKTKMSFAELQHSVLGQFRGLDTKDPGSWPALPRLALCLFVTAAIVVALWFVWLNGSADELDAQRKKEVALREDYSKKLAQAVMDALLSDINQAGLGRSLNFELFRPGSVSVKEYYAELPIALRVTGRFHDVGAFAADVANLSRIVTLNNIAVLPAKDGTLTLDATAKTFRYLDRDEIAAQRKATPGAKKK